MDRLKSTIPKENEHAEVGEADRRHHAWGLSRGLGEI